jgi:hypothetical protein
LPHVVIRVYQLDLSAHNVADALTAAAAILLSLRDTLFEWFQCLIRRLPDRANNRGAAFQQRMQVLA